MNEIRCPKCGEIFTVDESGYAAIVKQVRDDEFRKEIEERENGFRTETENAVSLAVVKAEAEKDKRIAELEKKLSELQSENKEAVTELKSQLQLEKINSEGAVDKAVQEKEKEILELNSRLALEQNRQELREKSIRDEYEAELKRKEEEVAYYKDFKARQSTKMVGESLEQHCETEFNKLRATAFPKAYFEKDNDARTGSKGDFIYRECSDDGVEFISVMFEMKNEMDETATKHKNEDFFKELDKDRKEKGCEYAVLVTMLEADNELYNTGIVDVSYRYEKMYVIRPQFFIPLITILRNAAQNSLSFRRQLREMQSQNIDITNFESEMTHFKEEFSKNVDLAAKKFGTAIDEIDKSIDHLQKIREALLSSDHHLQIANRKVEDLSIKKLTKNNPTMKEKFAALKGESDNGK